MLRNGPSGVEFSMTGKDSGANPMTSQMKNNDSTDAGLESAPKTLRQTKLPGTLTSATCHAALTGLRPPNTHTHTHRHTYTRAHTHTLLCLPGFPGDLRGLPAWTTRDCACTQPGVRGVLTRQQQDSRLLPSHGLQLRKYFPLCNRR